MTRQPETSGVAPVVLRSVLVLAAIVSGHALAQTVDITPRLNLGLTWSDNIDTDDERARKDWLLNIAPGLSVSRASGRLRGQFDASLRSLAYASEHEENETHLTFSGNGLLELLEDSLFINAQASVSRNNTSAFGRRASGDQLSARKDDETRVWSLAPYWQMRFGDRGQARLGYELRALTGGNDSLSNTREQRWTLSVEDTSALRFIGWGFNYQHLDTRYKGDRGRDVAEEIARALLYVNLDPQYRLKFSAGHESNDYQTARREKGSLWGAGFDWYPTERTSLTAMGEKRFFGHGYDVQFQHRQARALWQFGATRQISSTLQELAGGFTLDPVFQGIYQLTDETLSEAERMRLAREEYERMGGLGVRSNSYYLQQSLRAGLSLIGVRNTLTLTAQRSDRQRLNNLLGVGEGDDFARHDNIDTRSLALALSHRLTSLSTLNLAASYSHAEGQGADRDDVRRNIYQLGLTRRLSADTNLGLIYRHQKARGTDDYRENAVSATLGTRF